MEFSIDKKSFKQSFFHLTFLAKILLIYSWPPKKSTLHPPIFLIRISHCDLIAPGRKGGTICHLFLVILAFCMLEASRIYINLVSFNCTIATWLIFNCMFGMFTSYGNRNSWPLHACDDRQKRPLHGFCGFVQGRNMHKQYRNVSRCLHDEYIENSSHFTYTSQSFLPFFTITCLWTNPRCILCMHRTASKNWWKSNIPEHWCEASQSLNMSLSSSSSNTSPMWKKRFALPAPLAIAIVVGCDLLYLGWCVSCSGWSSRVHRWRA